MPNRFGTGLGGVVDTMHKIHSKDDKERKDAMSNYLKSLQSFNARTAKEKVYENTIDNQKFSQFHQKAEMAISAINTQITNLETELHFNKYLPSDTAHQLRFLRGKKARLAEVIGSPTSYKNPAAFEGVAAEQDTGFVPSPSASELGMGFAQMQPTQQASASGERPIIKATEDARLHPITIAAKHEELQAIQQLNQAVAYKKAAEYSDRHMGTIHAPEFYDDADAEIDKEAKALADVRKRYVDDRDKMMEHYDTLDRQKERDTATDNYRSLTTGLTQAYRNATLAASGDRAATGEVEKINAEAQKHFDNSMKYRAQAQAAKHATTVDNTQINVLQKMAKDEEQKGQTLMQGMSEYAKKRGVDRPTAGGGANAPVAKPTVSYEQYRAKAMQMNGKKSLTPAEEAQVKAGYKGLKK